MFIEVVPDYAVDIPLIWQYIGEIIGAFIGAPSSNMILLKPILQLVPDDKSKQLFQDIIRYAVEFSVRIMFNLIFFNLFWIYFSRKQMYKVFGNQPVFH